MTIEQHFDYIEIDISGEKISCKLAKTLRDTINNICICVADAINFANYKSESDRNIVRSHLNYTFAELMCSLDKSSDKLKNKLSIFRDINSYTTNILNDDSFVYKFGISNLRFSIYTIHSLIILQFNDCDDSRFYRLYIRRDNVGVARIILVLERYIKMKNAAGAR